MSHQPGLAGRLARAFVHFDPSAFQDYAVSASSGGATAFALPDGVSNWGGTWSVTTPVFEPGKMANWIAPPPVGINRQPIDFDYVRFN